MSLANLENAREQLKLADNGVSVHIQDAIDSVDSAIRELEALPVVPTVEVGQVWVGKYGNKYQVVATDFEVDEVWVRPETSSGNFTFSVDECGRNLKLKTPTPVPLTGEEVES